MNPEGNRLLDVLKLLATIFKEVGLVGFMFVVTTSIFVIWGTREQKQEFIDTFVLLKNSADNPVPSVFIVVLLLLILVLSTVYNQKMLRYRKEEIKRLGEEKSRLQEILLQRTLSTSNTEKE